jgi:hypothetical protein
MKRKSGLSKTNEKIIEEFLKWVCEVILERGGDPSKANLYEIQCGVCKSTIILIESDGNTFSGGSGLECCLNALENTFIELGIKTEERVSASLVKVSDLKSFKPGPASFMNRMRNKENEGMVS